ncbi:MAG: HAD family phosphatase [Phycisphaerae bacterium]|nr:HAD family phosphatase [Phycisphaerae bacterium]
MPIRLLVVDLDGTLLNRAGRVSPRNAEAVRRAEAAGIEVVVATGRSWLESTSALEAIGHRREGHDRLFIGAGGATLHDARTGAILDRRTLDEPLVEAISESVLQHGHLAHLLQDPQETGRDYMLIGDAELDPASEWWFRTHPVSVERHASIETARPLGATIRAGTVAVGAELAKLAAALKDDLGDRVMLQHWSALTETEVVGSATHLLECFAPDTNKWTMAARVAARRAIDTSAIAAVGDGLNDLALIQNAALGIAMGNADPRIAEVARMHVGHHDADGFADAVERVLGKK